MKNILVTGGAGFIGSAFVRIMTERYPDYNLIVYDKLTYAGNMENLSAVSDEPNYRFERGDIADRSVVSKTLQAYQIDTIVNFAAESHVDRSIIDADAFLHTNSIGVYILLDEGRKHGIERFLQVSTDEVYGSVPVGESVESDPLAPRNPYSAAKAGGELMVRAYFETYGMNVVTTRGSNTFGPNQYPEKLLPFFITEALEDHPLPLYGDGKQQRDWLYVEDHVNGIDMVLHKGVAGEAYNIAGEDLRYNVDVTDRLLVALGKPQTLIRHVPDREGHDLRYAMNCDKARALGWNKQFSFDSALEATVRWYIENEFWWKQIKTGDYLEYYKKQYAARLAAAEQN
jgi:dTDP-glucose 4,6-dehydratase